METNKSHTPVLLKEVIENLEINPKGFYIDGTLGEGGHSNEIWKNLNEEGLLVSIDRDQSAIDFVNKFYCKELKNKNWRILNANFTKIPEIVRETGRTLNGVILDLGLSSRQLEIEEKGFSYLEESQPLDMRTEDCLKVKASDLINALSENELIQLFRKYGEEPNAVRIAKAIKKEGSEFNTVGDLLQVIYKVVPTKYNLPNTKNPARRVFQALRIAVNDEINNLKDAIKSIWEVLPIGGKLLIISFQSLEDKEITRFIKENKIENVKIIKPTEIERVENNRSRSAILRVISK